MAFNNIKADIIFIVITLIAQYGQVHLVLDFKAEPHYSNHQI